jgi:hypothetical protein
MNSQNPRPSKPATEHTLEVRLERVLDLRSPEQLRRLGLDLTPNEDAIESWTPYQRIGGAVSLLGLEGLLVPSVRLVDGVNLVIYTDNVQPVGTSEVTVASSQPFTPAATG